MLTHSHKLLLWYLLVLAIILLIGIPLKYKSHKEDAHISIYGECGVCLVTEKRLLKMKNSGSLYYSVRYEYEINGEKYFNTHTFYNMDHYDDAIVGMKYEVKYLGEKPKKSFILLNCPIVSEYINIEKERDRMRTIREYKRGLENAEPIELIKERYPDYFPLK